MLSRFARRAGRPVAIGRDLRAQVLQWTGLPTSVGFGPTKTLAKLANHVAKTADRKPGSYPPSWPRSATSASGTAQRSKP
jgi:nucleotidyltransferase/DNA polymerase involved in DNA repair